MQVKRNIALSEPCLGESEKQALCRVIDSGWLTMGENVEAFEKEFATLHQHNEAVAVNSCTAGLHLVLRALGVGVGDEVLVPSMTFVATVNSVLYVGAKPVFVDIEDIAKPHISLDLAQHMCTGRTKAVIGMHYGGYMMPMSDWRQLARSNNIFIIEDAAHTPGMDEVGHFSDAAVFSFFSNKNMTTAEGGMVLAREQEVLDKVRLLRAHAMTKSTLDRDRGHAFTYDVLDLGYNYRLDELRAVVGREQLKKLPEWNEKRRKLNRLYRSLFAEIIPELNIPFADEVMTSAHIMPILLPEGTDKNRIMTALRENGIQTSIHYPPVHMFSYHRTFLSNDSLPKTEEFFRRELSLPLYPGLVGQDVEYVVNALQKCLSKD